MRFHEVIHPIYFDDLDAFRILHNARYVLLFERTIGAFWRHLGWGGPLDDANPDRNHLVRANHIEYLRPVEGVGQVRVRVWIQKLGTTSLVFALRCLPVDEDTAYATGSRVLVRVSANHRRPEPWSAAFRQKVAPYCEQQDS